MLWVAASDDSPKEPHPPWLNPAAGAAENFFVIGKKPNADRFTMSGARRQGKVSGPLSCDPKAVVAVEKRSRLWWKIRDAVVSHVAGALSFASPFDAPWTGHGGRFESMIVRLLVDCR